jgi:3-polyprenyl-4-hydroxybenzoate decarboxylase
MPSFYYQPGNIDEMASFFAGRLAEFIGLEVKGLRRWHGID